MSRLVRNRAPVSEMEDEQRKAMFARMRGGGGGGGGGGRGGSGHSSPPYSPYSGGSANQHSSASTQLKDTTDPFGIRAKWELREQARREQKSFWENAWESTRHFFGDFHDPLSFDDYTTLAMAIPGFGVAIPAGSGAVATAGKMTPALKSFLKTLGVFGGSLAAGQGISAYRDHNPTIDPRLDHYLSLGQDAANTIAALSGIQLARLGLSKIPGMGALGKLFGKAGDKLKAFETAVAGKTPTWIKNPLSYVAKAYNAVAGFTGSEIRTLSEIPQLSGHMSEARALKAVSTLYADKAAKVAATDPARSAWLAAQATKFGADAALETKKAMSLLARAGYVAAGIVGVHTTEQAIKDKYRRDMEESFAKGQPFVLNPDSDIAETPLKRALMFTVGTLGNPVEKQTRDYVAGRWTKDLAERAYQEYQYDTIETARKSGAISDKMADALQIERAKNRPFNMSGKSLYSFTPALAGYAKFAATQTGKAVKYRDPSEIGKLWNPDHAAGVGLMAYGNTVGSKLPSSIPISWNALLAAQGVSQAYKKGPRNQRGKVYKPLDLDEENP